MTVQEAKEIYNGLERLHLRLIDMEEEGKCSRGIVEEANRKCEQAFQRYMNLKGEEDERSGQRTAVQASR
jgi:hypothetical protein